jgi:16S rRNA (cytidine1402-2'-O)-methyltransferase
MTKETFGRIYLVPNLLGIVPPADVLPQRTIDIARSLVNWAVETPKPARAFLKSLAPERPIAELAINPIGDLRDARSAEPLLAPALRGEDVGVLSDAGCPGVADPGAMVVAAAHAHALRVIPLVGPSSLLLALMAAGMNGQRFAFHGYLPAKPETRAAALRRLEADSRAQQCTQLFIETPYRNVALLTTIANALAPATRVCVAVDLTLPTESVATRPVREWQRIDFAAYAKRPAIFLIQA